MFLKWIRAVCLAGYHTFRLFGLRDVRAKLQYFLGLLISKRADSELATNRLRHCAEKCAIYDTKNETCGFTGETWWNHAEQREDPFGCWCHMPTAVRIAGKDCWLRANGAVEGWGDKLRPPQK